MSRTNSSTFALSSSRTCRSTCRASEDVSVDLTGSITSHLKMWRVNGHVGQRSPGISQIAMTFIFSKDYTRQNRYNIRTKIILQTSCCWLTLEA